MPSRDVKGAWRLQEKHTFGQLCTLNFSYLFIAFLVWQQIFCVCVLNSYYKRMMSEL